MNRIFRTLWSVTRQCWQAVPENAKSAGKGSAQTSAASSGSGAVASFVLSFLMSSNVSAQSPPAAKTLPTGGVVAQGAATFSQTATAQAAALTVNQSSQRAVISWNTFNLGSAASVNFAQPNAQAVTLNRVSDANPSQIYGRITAPGQVFLSNPNGVYFSPTAQVDVGALTATTHGISDDDFMAGNYRFDRNGATGKVVNEGKLNAALGGYIALLAPEVQNAGVVVAQAGTVAMAAGELITLNLNGVGGLATLTTTPSAIASLVENKHAVLAPDGQIVLSAIALNKLQGGVVKNSGSLEANSLVNKGGKIVLEGDDITLNRNSKIEAKGPTGGGTVLVGGDWQGSGDLRHATKLTMEAGATIDASAKDKGDGGKVVLWSDVHNADSVTRVNGRIKAEAGPNGGDGGKVETSGHVLNVDDIKVSTNAPQGNSGEWLLDPYDITISTANTASVSLAAGVYTPSNDSTLKSSDLESALLSGNVEVSTLGSALLGVRTGSIFVNAPISWTTANTLKLSTYGVVVGSSNISIGSVGGGLIINQRSDNAASESYSGVISGNGSFTKDGAGTLNLTGANTYSGVTTISAGTLQIGIGGTLGSLGTGAVTNNAALKFKRSDAITISNYISGSGTLTQAGTGTTTLTGANSYGATTISAGTLQIGSGGTAGTLGTGAVTDNAALIFNRSDAITISNAISGTGTLTQAGTGTTTLTGANSYGATTISAGTLQIGNGGTSGSLGTGAVADNTTLIFNRSDNITVGNTITGSGSVQKLGANTLTFDKGPLAISDTFTGGTTISGGTLKVNPQYIGTSFTSSGRTISVSQGATFYIAGSAGTLNSTISGAGGITVETPSIANYITLGNANTYTGPTYLKSGGLRQGGASVADANGVFIRGPLGVNSALTIENAADTSLTLMQDTQIGSLSGGGNLGGTVGLYGKTLIVGGNNTNSTFSGVILDGSVGILRKVGTGTLTLTGTNTYVGKTEIKAGTLRAASNAALGAPSGGVEVASGATLEIGGTTAPGNVAIGAEALTIASGGTVHNVAGANTYAGALTLTAPTAPAQGDYTITIDTGTSLNFSATGGSQVVPANSVLNLNLTSGNLTFGKALSGTPGTSTYVKVGSGTLTMPASTGMTLKTGVFARVSDPTGNDFSTAYGDTPDYTFGFYDSATGGNIVNVPAANYTVGTLAWTGTQPVAGSAVGNYSLTYASGLTVTSANYVLMPGGGATTWTVIPKPVTVSLSRADFTYNGLTTYADLAAGATITTNTPLVGGDTIASVTKTATLVGGGAANGVAQGGTYNVTPSNAVMGVGNAANYNFSYAAGTGTVLKAPLTMTANNASILLGQADPVFTARYTGFLNGDTPAALTTPTVVRVGTDAAEGTYANVLRPSATSNNYNITPVNGAFTIVPADTLLIKVADVNKTYGAAPTYTVTSAQYLKTGDPTPLKNVTVTATGGGHFTYTDGLLPTPTTGAFDLVSAATANSDVSNYAITVSNFTKTGTNFTALTPAVQAGNLAVVPLTATLSPTVTVSKTYDTTTTATGSVTITNKVGTDDVSVSGTGQYTDNADVGTTHTYSLTGLTLGGAKASNYAIDVATLPALAGNNGVITAAQPALTGLSNQNKTAGSANYTLAAASNSGGAITYTSSDPTVATVNPATGEVTLVAAGNAVITATQAANGNYAAGNATYTLTVAVPPPPAPPAPPPNPALTNAEILALTAAQVAALTSTQLGLLTNAQMALFNATQLAAMTAAQIALFTQAQIGGLTANQVQALSVAQLTALTPATIASLSINQVAALTATQIQSLTSLQLAALTAGQIGTLSPANLAAFTAAQLGALSTNQLVGLSGSQVAALSTQQLSGLTPSQLGSLSDSQLSSFSLQQAASFTATQLAGLTAAQLALLIQAPTPPAPTPPTPPAPVVAPPVLLPPVVTPPVVASAVVSVPAPVLSPVQTPVVVVSEVPAVQVAAVPAPQVSQSNEDEVNNRSGIQVRTLPPSVTQPNAIASVHAQTPPQAQAPVQTQAQTPTPTPVDVITIPAPVTTLATASQSTGVLPITVLDGGSANRVTAAGVAFEQGANSITLRSLDTPPAVNNPRADLLAFNDKLTTFMVTSNVGELVEFQGSLIGNRLMIIAPTNSARQVARAEMKLVLAAAITTLGREQRVMLTDLQGVVFDLR